MGILHVFFCLADRVADAYWHLRKTVKMEQDGKKGANASIVEFTEKGDGLNHRVTAAHEKKKEILRGCSTSAERDLFDIVSFKQENFVHSWESPEKYYDAILWYVFPCLYYLKGNFFTF